MAFRNSKSCFITELPFLKALASDANDVTLFTVA